MRTTKPMRRFSGYDWKAIKGFYENGMSARKIAETYDVPHSTIVRGLTRKNVPIRRRVAILLNVAKTGIAYIAGLFDGEGHITIAKCKQVGRINFSYSLSIGITNTHKPVLEYTKSLLHGSIRCRPKSALSIKPVWGWHSTSRNAYTILKALYPYLRIKKRRALIAIKLQDRINAFPARTKLTKRELSCRDRAYMKIRTLNGRGLFVQNPERKKLVYDYLKQFQAKHPNAGRDHIAT